MAVFSFDLPDVSISANVPNNFTTIATMKIPAGGKLVFPKTTRAVVKLYGKDSQGNVVELDKKDELYIAFKTPADSYLTPLTEIIRYRPFSSLTEDQQRDVRKTPTIKFNKKAESMVAPGDAGLVFMQDSEIYVLLKSKYTLAVDTVDDMASQVFELLDVEFF